MLFRRAVETRGVNMTESVAGFPGCMIQGRLPLIEAASKKILEKLKMILDKNLKHLISDYKSNLNWVIYTSIWHLDGVAKTIENEKPEIKTPIKNLFLIGDCTKAPGIGINCAINSSRILINILSDKN